MSGFNKFLFSSIGNKLLVTITGLFLILFLIVHLLGNIQLLIPDGGETFNVYSEIFGSNLIIKFVAYTLYAAIILHTYKGISIWAKNRKARGSIKYAGKAKTKTTFSSRNMMWLGSLIFVFIVLHMSDFWFKFKFTDIEAQNMSHFDVVQASFQELWIVIVYVLGMVVLGYHLAHGFQSAFQTLGLRKGKYTKIIQRVSVVFAILMAVLFAIIPVLMYLDIYPLPAFKVLPVPGAAH